MHIVTGLVLAGAASQLQKQKNLQGLPRFRTGPLRVAHAVPGRIRFVLPALRGADGGAPPWIADLAALPGVLAASANSVSGSITVHYQPEAIDPPRLFGAVARLAGVEEELGATPISATERELGQLGASLNHAVYDMSGGVLDFKTLLLLSLAAAGARDVAARGWGALPGGFTLMWWAANSLLKPSRGAV